MKYGLLVLVALLPFSLLQSAYAQAPNLADADRLLDFAENVEPSIFFPPAQTQQTNSAGADWFFRYYTGTDSYAAININGTGKFTAGNVYVLGDSFGPEPVLVGSLVSLLVSIDAQEPSLMVTENAMTNPGNGNCVARRFAAANDTATFKTSIFSGDTTLVFERTEFYEAVAELGTTTVFEQTTTTDGVETMTSERHITAYESSGGMLSISATDSVVTTSTSGSFPSVQGHQTSYSPSLFIGPSDFFCEGQQWEIAPTQKIDTDNPDLAQDGATTSQTLSATGTVDAVNENVQVQNASYTAVKMTMRYPDSKTIIWIDAATGVVVMSETYQASSENPSRTDQLLQLDLPF